jgi:hypothetical protein
MLSKADRFILGGVVVVMLVNFGSSWLMSSQPKITVYLGLALVTFVVLWALYKVTSPIWALLTAGIAAFGRFAVLVYFVSRDQQLLMILHPHFKRRLPPGGRLNRSELPDHAVERVLLAEAGIAPDAFEYHPLFHETTEVLSERVETVVRPFLVQRERRWQRGLIRFHYAFVYVCRFKNQDLELTDLDSYHPKWFSLNELSSMTKHRTFDDVPIVARKILAMANEKSGIG